LCGAKAGGRDARTSLIHGSTPDSSYLVGWEHEVDNLGFVVIPSLAEQVRENRSLERSFYGRS
jgi:hypothetical protein